MDDLQMRELLAVLLECGYADLDILEDCKYDMHDVVEYAHGMVGDKVDINTLCYSMFQMALQDVQEAIDEAMTDYRADLEENREDFTEDEINALEEVLSLDLNIQEDVETYHNFIDTHANLVGNEEVYTVYFQEQLKIFEENTGFTLEGY